MRPQISVQTQSLWGFGYEGEAGDMYFQVDSNHDATSASSNNLDVATGGAMNRLSQNK